LTVHAALAALDAEQEVGPYKGHHKTLKMGSSTARVRPSHCFLNHGNRHRHLHTHPI